MRGVQHAAGRRRRLHAASVTFRSPRAHGTIALCPGLPRHLARQEFAASGKAVARDLGGRAQTGEAL